MSGPPHEEPARRSPGVPAGVAPARTRRYLLAVTRPALAALLLAAGCGSEPTVRRGGTGSDLGESCVEGADCKSAYCFERRCASALPAGACAPPGTPNLVLGAPNPLGPAEPPAAPADPPCAQPLRSIAGFTGGVQSLGAHAVGADLDFQVPAGTSSFTLVFQEVDGSAPDEVTFGTTPDTFAIPNAPAPRTVIPPGSDTPFFDLFARMPADPSGELSEYVGFLAGSGSVTFPNTSRALDLFRSAGQVTPGTWRLELSDDAAACQRFGLGCAPDGSGVYDVKVLTRAGPYRATATLDLDVYFVSTEPGLTAADALADPATNATARHFRRFVAEVSRILARGGLCLGTVRAHDLPAWAVEEFHDLDIDAPGPCAPLARLFTLSAPTNAVHLFLVDALLTGSGTGGSTVVGIDGTIPGPSAVPGTVNSGAAVLISDLAKGTCGEATDVGRCGADRVAHIAAHEAGHWLGLYHPTESNGLLFDPLADTGKCPCSTCASASQRPACGGGGAVVDASRCRTSTCGGGQNLMFWQVSPGGEVTREQGEVMRANPAAQ